MVAGLVRQGVRGLEELGILTVSAEEALAPDKQLHKRYTLHNVSHMLGIDVHDCAKARQEEYKFGSLKPGMVFTVEPWYYNHETGISVFTEDVVLVTEDGAEVLSAGLPRTPAELERMVSRP